MTSPKRSVLQKTTFGKRIAEEEVDQLASYFVETDQWRRIYAGDVDIVFGDKGAGKSAIYSLLVSRAEELFDRGIILVPGERPRGAPAFKDLVVDPPTSQPEFVGLWKLYFLCLLAQATRDWGIRSDASERVVETLEAARLIEKGPLSLQALIRGALDYIRALRRAESLEGGFVLDPTTGVPVGLTGKITLREPSPDERREGLRSMDSLFAALDETLAATSYTIWLVLDRLDVAFADSDEVEGNALRALFAVYSDLREYRGIEVKIFLRTDIWRRITRDGMREASHVEDQAAISWDSQSLLNLVIRRCLRNELVREFYAVNEGDVLSSVEAQRELFYRIFPDQVEAGSRKSTTFDWMLGRTRDGSGRTAPRELIHLLSSLRDEQLRMLEIGHDEPQGEQLFDRAAFKVALPEISRTRLEQTLYAEYPALRPYVERLDRRKSQQSARTLSEIWDCELAEAREVADQLVEVGFFERRQAGGDTAYWVPFLYRDALHLVQGTEGGLDDDSEEEDEGPSAEKALLSS